MLLKTQSRGELFFKEKHRGLTGPRKPAHSIRGKNEYSRTDIVGCGICRADIQCSLEWAAEHRTLSYGGRIDRANFVFRYALTLHGKIMIIFLLCLLVVGYLNWRVVGLLLEWYDTYDAEVSVRVIVVLFYILAIVGLSSGLVIWSSHGL